MDVDVKYVHVGEAINRRRNELGLSKSEFPENWRSPTAR